MASAKEPKPTEGTEPNLPPVVPLLDRSVFDSAVTLDAETKQLLQELGQEPARPTVGVNAREGFQVLLELDPSSLAPDFEYRFVLKHPQQVARRRAQGYTVVDPSREEVRNFSGEKVHIEADGTYTEGDCVLMKVPKHIHGYRRQARAARADGLLASETQHMKQTFVRSAVKHGVEVITTREPGRE